MQEVAFRDHLDQHFQEGYNHRYRSDIMSRCRRVEGALAVDLDDIGDCEELRNGISTIMPDENGQNSLLSAVKCYIDFKSGPA